MPFNVLTVLFAAAVGFLFGSIPWAVVIGKLFYHKDIREIGSGNPGATNAGRVFGRKAAIAVFVLDALKGFIVYLLFNLLDQRLALIAAFFVAVGHCYPLFSHFKGGKAVSTIYGILLAISLGSFKEVSIQVLVPAACFIALTASTHLVSLASISSVLISCIIFWITNENKASCLCVTALFLFMAFRHKENIKRLFKGEETKTSY
ncbi:MAG: glycerol-3-phosphate 1-O-acyltransferase PlsY [Erysipelotrichaceae bacterium]|nr:glycerol-3-phosphate 1-O-acyltransferase PlsY [Erysipelotrichaceae bacterium]